jgi:tetratricopeptide (TPR) repeat protein
MKSRKRHISLAILSFVLLASCAKDRADEEGLLLYARASSAYANGNFETAADLLADTGSFTAALVLRAKSLYFLDKDEDAEACLRKALRLNPASAEAQLFLVRILRDGDRIQEAEVLIENLLRGNPQDIRALHLASELASRRGDTEAEAALLDQAVEASAETALVFIDRARLRWAGGNGKGAMEDLSRAEILLPWNTPFSKSIGELKSIISSNQKFDEVHQ